MSHGIDHFYEFGEFRLNVTEHVLYRQDGTLVPLQPKALQTLEFLIRERSRLITKDELMEELWRDTFVEESNLAQNVYLLRKVLGGDSEGRKYIETVPKRGYRFVADVTEVFGSDLPKPGRPPWLRVAVSVAALMAGGGAVALAVIVSMASAGRHEPIAAPERTVLPFESVRLRRVTDSGDIADVALSPDGQSIAFATVHNGVWIQNLATGSRARLLPDSEAVEHRGLAFSRDGNQLYYYQGVKGRKLQLMRMSVLGGQPQLLLEDFNTW